MNKYVCEKCGKVYCSIAVLKVLIFNKTCPECGGKLISETMKNDEDTNAVNGFIGLIKKIRQGEKV
jgi:rRNA maturation endonuclease Nob1